VRREELGEKMEGAPNMARESVLRDYRQHSGSPKKSYRMQWRP
jgi:hypothetical protein